MAKRVSMRQDKEQAEDLSRFEIKLVWKDRKRFLGMPLSFTRYSISNDRLFLETGLLNTRTDEVLLYRVQDISLTVTLWQRIFGVGSIMVHSSDKTIPHLAIKNIKKPKLVKEILHHQVEKMKIERKMRVGEILDDHADCELCDDDMHGAIALDEDTLE